MTDVNKIKEDIRKNIIKVPAPRKGGGQSVGVIRGDIQIRSRELGLTINLGYSRSQHNNHEWAMKLFELALDLIVIEEIEQLPTEVYGTVEDLPLKSTEDE